MAEMDGQLDAAKTQNVESVALQLDAHARALRKHARDDLRTARAMRQAARHVRSGQVSVEFIGFNQDRIRARVASYAAAIGGAR